MGEREVRVTGLHLVTLSRARSTLKLELFVRVETELTEAQDFLESAGGDLTQESYQSHTNHLQSLPQV